MSVADRVDSILQERGLSRRQLAIKAGIPPSSLQSAMERGHNITLDMLQKIASALGVSVAVLLDVKPARAVDPNKTPEDKEKRLGMREGALSNAPRAEDVEAQNKADMLEAMDKLNIPGQQEAVKRVQEMADIERYKRRSLSDIWGFGKDGKPPK